MQPEPPPPDCRRPAPPGARPRPGGAKRPPPPRGDGRGDLGPLRLRSAPRRQRENRARPNPGPSRPGLTVQRLPGPCPARSPPQPRSAGPRPAARPPPGAAGGKRSPTFSSAPAERRTAPASRTVKAAVLPAQGRVLPQHLQCVKGTGEPSKSTKPSLQPCRIKAPALQPALSLEEGRERSFQTKTPKISSCGQHHPYSPRGFLAPRTPRCR